MSSTPSEPNGTERPRRGSEIQFEHVSKHYPGAAAPAVNDVTLSVEPGRIVVLLGPSGCGKTTLLKMVNRLYEPTGGHILIDGVETHVLPAPELRRRIGYVIQQTGLFPHMRIEENVAVVPRLLHWDQPRIDRRIDALLDLVGLSPASYRRRFPTQLSGGEQQRVGLARAMAADPTTMLMDEPFGALDAITRARLQDELIRIHHRLGQTILFVTHDIEEAIKLADRIAVMRQGVVVQYDTPLKIVMEPADNFVSELVGADDTLRRLSLISVWSVARPLNGVRPEPEISATSDLRTALGLLLESRAPALTVLDNDDKPVGLVDLEAIQSASGPQSIGAKAAP
ncbi:MAG: ABC transporter ATP-binding protein [Thermomicrobiales bacterium]